MAAANAEAVVRYRTIVADPPWHYDSWPVGRIPDGESHDGRRTVIGYPTMTLNQMVGLGPYVRARAEDDAHLYLWTTNRYLADAFVLLKCWGWRYSQTLVWAKTPMGQGPGGTWAQSTEYVLFGRRGNLSAHRRWDSTWFNWPRTSKHSRKPDAFLDMVEATSPGPYLEMFARRARFGWDYWGDESLQTVEMPA